MAVGKQYVVLDFPNKHIPAMLFRASCFFDGDSGARDAAVAWSPDALGALKMACAEAAQSGWAPTEFHIKPSALKKINGVVDSLTDDPGSPVFGLPVVIRET
ncbi:hypothetical protein UFOVP1382_14 [uncultured Caudovirales phage]|uniref:Uncharacterized protein n=1 Tax=uncultured Caudovirales phage TaxID=2100421 RepID=A0A6J5S584_9CAUD|nr:hypothetical protein UFOVP1382_14 [uncultured Caudovirales phage]